MGLLDRLFGDSVRETLEDAVHYEEQADIDVANEALFNRTDEDDNNPEGFYAPPPVKVWWRL